MTGAVAAAGVRDVAVTPPSSLPRWRFTFQVYLLQGLVVQYVLQIDGLTGTVLINASN